MTNLANLSPQEKIQWLKSQGVSDAAIQQRIGNSGSPAVNQIPSQNQNTIRPGGIDAFAQQAAQRPGGAGRGILEQIALSNMIPGLFSATGATLGGMAGGFAGIPAMGVGAVPGAIMGAGGGGAAGYAGGRSVQESLQSLLGVQDETPGQQLASAGEGTVKAGAASAAGEGIGLGTAGILGKLGSKLFGWGLKKPANVATREFTEQAFNKAAGETTENISQRMLREGIKGGADDWLIAARSGKREAYNKALDIASSKSTQPYGLVSQGTETAGKNTVLNFDEAFNEALAKKLRETPPGFIQEAGPAYQQVIDEIKALYGNDLSLQDLIELNKSINSKTFTAADNPSTSQAAKVEAYRALDDVIKPYLRQNYPEVADALADYGFYSQVEAIAKQTGRTQSRPPSNILQTINIPYRLLTNPQFSTQMGSAMASPALSSYMGAAGAGLGATSNAQESAQLRR